MNGNLLAKMRRRVGYGMTGLVALWAGWTVAPGLPVLRAPRARAEVREAGLSLFEHRWEPHDALAHGDGLGPVFNARACVSCHFQGGVGGGGGNEHNVVAFEAHPTKSRPEVQGGLIHKYAVADAFKEGWQSLRDAFPVVPGGARIRGDCYVLFRDFDPVHTERINATALFGAGWIDRIAEKTILHQSGKKTLARMGREVVGEFGGIGPGRPRVLADGRVGKFGWKAQFASLEEFVAAACANEIGLGNPRMPQATPRVRGGYPAVDPDLDDDQFRSLLAFVDTLPRPEGVAPADSTEIDRAGRGEELFAKVGCAACHSPAMGGVEGIYSDFLLHRLDDREGAGYGPREVTDVPLPRDYPQPEEWKTPPLWGVADSAPYFHDGGSPSLHEAILRHHGDAEVVTVAYKNLPAPEQEAIVGFLATLRAPAETKPAAPEPEETLAKKAPRRAARR